MSSEPVKSIEIDCPVSPYSQHHNHLQHHHHHHHHHHVLTCHHPHNHHSHPRLEVSNHIENDGMRGINDEVGEGEEENELSEVEIEKIRCLAQNKLNDCNDRVRCKATHLRHTTIEQNEPNIDDLSGGFLTGSCSGLTNGQVTISDSSDRYELANSTIASSTSTSPTSLQSSSPPSSSSSSDSSSSIEDGDDEDDDDDEHEAHDDEQVSDDDEDDDGASSEDENDDEGGDDDSEDIVDPVGNHHIQGNASCNQAFNIQTNGCNGIAKATNPIIDESISDDEEDEEDDDVSFDENDDSDDTSERLTPKHSMIDSSDTSDLLDSERMLEVTRKLVRSTERDPDRDLRKQVLLRTAIRRLPHFMEYNHYPDSFDQSFQLHSNTINCNNNDSNVTVNCLSTAQYYEHHHHLHMNHHIDSQPKSYYHSVQPNAIQMSTTSLRMLDLNDDRESEPNTIIDAEQQHQHYLNHHMGSYRANNEMENSVQTSLEPQQQHPHDYANHPQQPTLNMYHYSHQSTEGHHQHINSNDLDDQQNQRNNNNIAEAGGDHHIAIQELTQESGTNMIAHHDTIDNLYQPMTSGDIAGSDGSGVVDEPTSIAFPINCNYPSVDDVIQDTDGDIAAIDNGDKDCLSETKTFNDLDAPNNAQNQPDVSSTSAPNDSIDQNIGQQHLHDHRPECHRDNLTTANAYFSNNLKMPLNKFESICNDPSLSSKTGEMIGESIPSEANLVPDQLTLRATSEGNSDGNSDSSSHSLSSSDDGFSVVSRPNDSTDDIIVNASLFETSLNSTNDLHHSSHDSGVALFSPRSNKRSSSSIGLDDEMEIDHLSDLASISQQNTNSGSNINHCKKLRKKEVLD